MARVLVTGGNGFIGSHLCRALAADGHEVTVFDLPGTAGDAVADVPVTQVAGDICDAAGVRSALARQDAVYHLAAKVSDWGRWRDFERITVDGTRHVVVAARDEKVTQMVLMSSLAVHGWSSHVNADESTPRDVAASYPYGVAKRMAEDIVLEAHRRGEIRATIIRPGFAPFGPWDATSFAPLAEAMHKGQLMLLDGGRAKTCVSYVDNLARGMALTCLNEKSYGETFVLADDGMFTWKEIFDAYADALQAPRVTRSIPGWLAYAAAWCMDRIWLVAGATHPPLLTRYRINAARRDTHYVSTKAHRMLGFSPSVSFHEGVEKTAAWYKEVFRG